ncbi:hypothetical protein G7Y89_g8392 [Cudoniella acicularis]|uniref:Uncharacterized protein n=1 Tax=Cudoniella acicularis TaxID=354080 RepID=A0A8H4RKB9_9HELO|nr:hypothetical protein G7Y89_g8392 [Cudoniella acicularis]
MSNQISVLIDTASFVFSASRPESTDNVFLVTSTLYPSRSISLLLLFLVDSFKEAAIRRVSFYGILADEGLAENRSVDLCPYDSYFDDLITLNIEAGNGVFPEYIIYDSDSDELLILNTEIEALGKAAIANREGYSDLILTNFYSLKPVLRLDVVAVESE